jgi:nucleoid-associated protein YgaU
MASTSTPVLSEIRLTPSNAVAATAATYSAGAELRVITDGTTASLFYNNAKVGATATGITLAGTAHGIHADNTMDSLDNFTVYTRGTSGEYSGLNDLMAYGSQPGYTSGVDEIDIGAGARVYGDGKFENISTASGTTADLSVDPAGDDTTKYLDIIPPTGESEIIWEANHKKWKESSTTLGLTNTVHTIGDLDHDAYYTITVTDADATTDITGATCQTVGLNRICKSDNDGKLSFTYGGGYSDHTFDMALGDNTPPVTTATPAGELSGSTQSVTLACADNDGGSGCASIHYSTNGTDYAVYADETISIPVTTTLYFYSVDSNGNSETPKTETYTIDTTGPTGSITNDSGNPTNDPTPTFNLTIADSGVGIAGAQMKFSGNNSTYSNWEPSSATKTNFNINTGEGCDNGDGTKKIYVQFQDSLGNVGLAVSTGDFTLDTTASNAALSNTPATHGIYTSSTSTNITVGGTGVVSYKYKLDSGSYGEETLIATHLTLADLSEGSHTLEVIGKDAVGNWQSESDATEYSWTVDTEAPNRSDKSPSGILASGTTYATLSLTTGEVATCNYDTTSKDYGDMDNSLSTDDGTSHSAALNDLTDGGSYQYYVRCQDTAENANDTDYLISFSVAEEEVVTPDDTEDDDTDNDTERDLNVNKVKAESTQDSITITWKTDRKTKASVRYGTDKDLKEKKKDNEKEKKHKVILKDLLPDTLYYFRIKATDGDDNEEKSKIHSIKTLSNTAPETQPVSPPRNEDQSQNQTETNTASNGNTATPNVCSYIVESGDTLWSIAKTVYGDATAYPLIVENNKDRYPDINSHLAVGQELVFGCNDNQSQNAGNNSNTDNSNQQSQPQNQPQSESQPSPFHWWNPFTWF